MKITINNPDGTFTEIGQMDNFEPVFGRLPTIDDVGPIKVESICKPSATFECKMEPMSSGMESLLRDWGNLINNKCNYEIRPPKPLNCAILGCWDGTQTLVFHNESWALPTVNTYLKARNTLPRGKLWDKFRDPSFSCVQQDLVNCVLTMEGTVPEPVAENIKDSNEYKSIVSTMKIEFAKAGFVEGAKASAKLKEDLTNAVSEFISNIKPGPIHTDFKVVCDESNNSPEDIAKGLLHIDYQIPGYMATPEMREQAEREASERNESN